MIRLACLASIWLLLCSCSPQVLPPGQKSFFTPEDSLWELKINHWGKERFSGLLALRSFDSKLSVVILDATGIKLLTGVVAPTGPMQVTQALGVIQDKHLPAFLNNSLQAIFFESPLSADSCVYSGCIQICNKKTAANSTLKEARLGPFLLWSVSYFFDRGAKAEISQAMLQQPWKGTKMSLQLLSKQERILSKP